MDDKRSERESLADRLNKMLSALRSFGTNNAAAQGGIYQDVGRGWGTNNAAGAATSPYFPQGHRSARAAAGSAAADATAGPAEHRGTDG